MLYEMAIADAYAIPFEFVKHTGDRPNDLRTYHRHPKYHELITGQYTDDTQRSLANADVILGRDPYSPFSYAQSYVETFKSDPREGYSRGYQSFIKSVNSADEFLSKIRSDRESNGAVMGAAVLGFLPEAWQVKLAAKVQTITTHHPSAAVHAQVVALAAHWLLKGANKADLHQIVMLQADWNNDKDEYHRWKSMLDDKLGTSMKASSISAYAISACMRHDRMSDIIREAVDRGGDTDSAAATAIAIASCTDQIEKDLPQELVDGIENGLYGRDYLKQVDAQLMARWNSYSKDAE
jgi:ADP-ribosylglycohydrolase